MPSQHRYIVVEGPIGVGKTSLTKKLAATFGHDLLLEKAEDNPFLAQFYQNQRQYALSTQLFFLMQRTQQVQTFRQIDLFQNRFSRLVQLRQTQKKQKYLLKLLFQVSELL